VDRCRAAGLIVNATQGNVIRLLPAMTLTKPILRRGLAVLERVILEESGRPQ
jgi:4-aminobutyrate aminotransferase-like enzyme